MKKTRKSTPSHLWQSVLEQIGLSEKEALIYLTLLEQGEMGLTPLAEKAGLKRGIVYELTKRLADKKLVTLIESKARMTAQAQSPENLLEVAEQKTLTASQAQKQLQTVLDDIKTRQLERELKPVIKYNVGLAALRDVFVDMLKAKTKQVHFMGIAQYHPKIMDELLQFVDERAAKGIKTTAITIPTPYNQDATADKKLLINRKFLSESEYDSPIAINTYDNKVTFSNHKRSSGITIEDADIASAMRQIIDMLHKRL